MDYNKTGILCTKNKLWKQPKTVQSIVDFLLNLNYEFKEVVIGEPNNFIFADSLDEIPELFKKKGFYGIRIKVATSTTLIEINSNTDGINNVQYTVYAETEALVQEIIDSLQPLISIIGPSSNQLALIQEWFQDHKQVRNIIILVLVGVSLYLLGIHVFLFSIIQILFSFSPFITIYIIYLLFRNRRR